MAKPLVSDALWARIEPLLPRELPKPDGGRLVIRYERRADIHRGFLRLAAIVVCGSFLGIDMAFLKRPLRR